MINYNLRGFHNGKYCPLDKSEFIAGLAYSSPAKEKLKKLVDAIESLQLEEDKKTNVKLILEKGSYTKEENDLIFFLDNIIKMYSEYFPVKELLSFLNFQDVPEYIKKLDGIFIERYKNIQKNIMMIRIPTTHETSGLYIEIFAELGRFVGNVFNDIFNIYKEDPTVDLTIPNFIHYLKEGTLEKLGDSGKKTIDDYREQYGHHYNNIRHKKGKVSFLKTYYFIKHSHKVLDIVINNKELFI